MPSAIAAKIQTGRKRSSSERRPRMWVCGAGAAARTAVGTPGIRDALHSIRAVLALCGRHWVALNRPGCSTRAWRRSSARDGAGAQLDSTGACLRTHHRGSAFTHRHVAAPSHLDLPSVPGSRRERPCEPGCFRPSCRAMGRVGLITGRYAEQWRHAPLGTPPDAPPRCRSPRWGSIGQRCRTTACSGVVPDG